LKRRTAACVLRCALLSVPASSRPPAAPTTPLTAATARDPPQILKAVGMLKEQLSSEEDKLHKLAARLSAEEAAAAAEKA
jgi:hypothetical protein